jgi:adenosine deaminase
MNENLRALHEEGGMSMKEIVQLVRNSFEVAWLDDARRSAFLERLGRHVDGQPGAQ